METSLVKTQYIIALRNGMVAYIVSDSIADVARALDGNKFFNTKEGMLVNTADIVAIMPPSEWENQKRYQRGWYVQGLYWYDKNGRQEDATVEGKRLEGAYEAAKKVNSKETALFFVEKLKEKSLYDLFKRYNPITLEDVEAFFIESPLKVDTTVLVNTMKK